MLYRVAYIFVIITGLTGLVYQVTWHQYISFFLGSHAMAAALVLAVFFLFLSLGYAVLGRNIHRIPIANKLFVYGIIEALIGLYALISPRLFHLLIDFMPAGAQSPVSDFALGFVFTTAYIGIPTFLMGTTIPLLTQALAHDYESSHGTHAAVYGLNTLGAVFGALLAGFVLINIWGLPLTLLKAGILNILIGFATWIIWKARPLGFQGITPEAEAVSQPSPSGTRSPIYSRGWIVLLLVVSFASGFYVFSLETLMIRVAGLVLGSSKYTYAMIVAAFILGIALGSLWVGRRRISGPRFFLGVQSALLVSAILLYLIVPVLPEWFARVRVLFAPSYLNIPYYWVAVFLLFATILLIPVALMGMNLPLIFNYLRSRGLFLSQTVGRIYAINTLGSVLGALVGGYLLYFWLTWDGVFRFNLVLIALTLPFVAALAGMKRGVAAVAAALPLLVVLALPKWDDHAFLPAASNISGTNSTDTSLGPILERLREGMTLEFTYHGADAHVGVIRRGGVPSLLIDGNPNTGGGDWELRAMNAIYPLSFAPRAKSAFVVGLGGGLSTSIFAEMPGMERVLVSEIARGVIKALPYFDEQNADFTTQPYYTKADFVAADAIKMLRASPERFDIIVSEPNHPWVAGVENLFSVEFLSLIRDRLTDEGVYCQWFPLFVSEPGAVLTILNTFTGVFPHVRAFAVGGGTFSILASNRPLKADIAHMQAVLSQLEHRLTPQASPFTDPYVLLGTEVLSEWALKAVVEDFPVVHAFEFPVIGASASRARFAGVGASMTTDVMDRLHRLPSANDASARMLLEDVRGQLEAVDLDRVQAQIKQRGELAELVIPRLWYQRRTWFDGEPDWPSLEERRLLSYVSGLSDDFPAHLLPAQHEEPVVDVDVLEMVGFSEAGMEASGAPGAANVAAGSASPRSDSEKLTLAASLFNVYRQLIRARVPARLDRVIEAMPEKCESVRCVTLQQAIVQTAMSDRSEAEQLNQLDLRKTEGRAKISALFNQLQESM